MAEFTEQEFQAAIEAKPELIGLVTKVLGAKEYSIFSKEQKTAYEQNIEAQTASKFTSRVALEVEGKVKELTGIEKASPDEKWTDYYQRALKTSSEDAKEIRLEISELKSKTNLSEAERQQLAELQKLQKSSKEEVETLKKTHQSEITKLKAGNQILSDVTPIRSKFINDDRVKAAIDVMHNQTVQELTNSAQIDPNTGKPIFFGADGKALLNQDASYKTAAQIYEERMDGFIDKGRKQGGAGGDGGSSQGVPAGVRNQIELSDYLISRGFIGGSKEFNVEFNKLKGNLPRR